MARWLLLLWLLALGANRAHADEFTPFAEAIPVGAFTLVERSGATVGPADLLGKVWIAHFFYPTCQGPCTKTVPTMRRLQEIFRGKPDVRLVSIALTGDEPKLLQQFALDQQADGAQWLFLTQAGQSDEVLDIVQKCFFQTAQRKENAKPGDEIDHTTSLIVVDRTGLMRGYIDGKELANAPLLAESVRRVAAERYVLPAVNAVLNTLCTLLLISGWLAIKLRRERLHKALMLAALAASAAFLAGYLYFHFAIQAGQPTRFRGEGGVQLAYFAILLSHTVLAVVVTPMALYTAWLGLRDRRQGHVRIARLTLPMWLYVSITGVVVYWMLYQLYPPY